MLKKLLIVGVIAGAAVLAFKGTRFISHVKHEVSNARDWAETQLPMEKKFAHLRKDVDTLDRDLEKVKNELAREIVEVRELTVKTGELRAQVENEKKVLVTRGEAITDATEKVKYGSSTVSIPEAKHRLEKDVKVHVNNQNRLKAMETTLTHRESIKETLQKTLDTMKNKKADLLAEIDSVEAEYKTLQLTQVESKYQTDDSKLAKIKETLRQLKKSVDIEKEKLALTPSIREVQSTSTDTNKSVKDILAPLNVDAIGEVK